MGWFYELEAKQPDRVTIQDAIESQLGDDEPSEPQVRSVTSAVIRSLKAE